MAGKQALEFAVWDVTESPDSLTFIKMMSQKLGWRNLLDDVPKNTKYIEKPERHSIFMPCGPTGEITDPQLFKEVPLFQKQVFSPNHGTGRDPSLLYVSGHGIPGFIFSNNTEAIPIVSSDIIGEQGNSGAISPPVYQWNSDQLKYIIFSSCRQLSGKPQQALWARAMRGEKPLHGILGYRDTSPAAGLTGPIIKRFVEALASGQTILNAWKIAHRGFRENWAALIHKEALKDTAVQWARDGHLTAKPLPQGEILYFDYENPSGREVKEPPRYLDIKLVEPVRVKPNQFEPGWAWPNWRPLKPGVSVYLRIELTEASGMTFEPGDRIWISAAQVRPSYEAPFNILELFSIPLPKGDSMTDHGIKASARIHDRSRFGPKDFDTYEFSIPVNKVQALQMLQWLGLDQSSKQLFFPIKIGKARFLDIQYNRLKRHPPLPLFYLMGRVEKRNGKAFGIPAIPPSRRVSQKLLIDDFQFAVFVLLSKFPKQKIY